jgi:predicted CoA-binding protein
MTSLCDAAKEFLTLQRIAVAGVSRGGNLPANHIYRKLRLSGHTVFAVNPSADHVEGGEPAFATLSAIPGGLDGVVIATHPRVTGDLVRECATLGIRYVWIHRSVGGGSVDDAAVRLCEEFGISVIPGSCPMMFCEPVDVAHRCLRWFLRVTGREAIPHGCA